jgi:O-antigen/teichoic acid export membrane protein
MSIKSKLSFLAKDVAIFGLANAFSKLFAIILVPILVRMLTKEEYGMVDGINILVALFLPIIIFGQDSSIARYYFEIKDEQERKQMISQSLAFQFGMSICTILFFQLLSPFLANNYLRSENTLPYIQIAAFSLFFIYFIQFSSNLLKWTFKRTQFLILTIGYPIVMLGVTIAMLKYFAGGVQSVFYAQLVAGFIFSLVALFFVKGFLVLPKSFNYLPSLLKFGWPYFLIMALPNILPSLDRYFITKYISLEYLGMYALAFRIASLVQLPIFGFQTAWGPFAYSMSEDPNANKIYDTVLKLYLLLLFLFAIGLNIFLKPIIVLFADVEYLSASPYVIPILLAFVLESVSWVTGIGIDLSKRTYLSAVSYFISIILGAGLTWFFVLNYGLIGLVFAGIASKFLYTAIKTAFAHFAYHIRFDYFNILILMVTGTLANVYLSFFIKDHLAQRFVVGTLFMVLLLVISWFLFLKAEERSLILKKISLK